LVLTNDATASSTPQDVTQVTIWDGSTQVGTAVFTSSDYATSTLSTPVTINKDSDKVVTVKVDLASIGTSLPGHEGALVKVDYNGNDSTGTEGIGAGSGRTVDSASSSTECNGVRVFRSYPVFAQLSIPSSTLVTGDMDLYRFSVTAQPSSSSGIGIYNFTVNIATSTGSITAGTTTVTDLRMYAYTNEGFSSPVSGFTNGLLKEVNSGGGLVSSGDTTVAPTSILQVPAGATYYFKVVGTVALTAGSGTFSGSVTTKISGDTAYPSLATTLMDAAATIAGKLTWSPNSTTTAVAAANDWTNGYYVQGLPSTGMNSVTISK
jgi:hypothetical protein